MKICKKISHSYEMYCREEVVKILKCYLIPKKSYGTLSKSAIFFLANPVYRCSVLQKVLSDSSYKPSGYYCKVECFNIFRDILKWLQQ